MIQVVLHNTDMNYKKFISIGLTYVKVGLIMVCEGGRGGRGYNGKTALTTYIEKQFYVANQTTFESLIIIIIFNLKSPALDFILLIY